MKKIAFFVEGQTEQIFLNHLIKYFLGKTDTTIILKKTTGGTNAPHREIVRSKSIARQAKYLVMICDCGADNRVKTEILDNMESLHRSGYSMIIGVRDLYPLPEDDLPRLEKGLNFLPNVYKKWANGFDIIVAVQEVETWFLAEYKHLKRVDKRLTPTFIKQRLGFDPYHENAISRKHPSKDLDNIYRLVGRTYTKKHWQVEKLVRKLDFDNMYRNIRYEIPAINQLFDILDALKKR
ncbi:hypothetical protein M2132_000945 [Dysgonomonas sp. PH5-45]|uniref:DUF4276 family protein n=1 Tax=unclassified Dysgonomonas TaxID=2630389 RepID=UPI0024730FA6|nr:MULTISPECIES: DUF4276 family protein [unclassified Dysgonomonas]MDH6354617.1 hypothetical protein [Dysgonomonas sp. PH5-45]MDH6387515.1 hypothetical protein [Dysgonomonas sp. PH5-37]